jgi:hypothetical protein
MCLTRYTRFVCDSSAELRVHLSVHLHCVCSPRFRSRVVARAVAFRRQVPAWVALRHERDLRDVRLCWFGRQRGLGRAEMPAGSVDVLAERAPPALTVIWDRDGSSYTVRACSTTSGANVGLRRISRMRSSEQSGSKKSRTRELRVRLRETSHQRKLAEMSRQRVCEMMNHSRRCSPCTTKNAGSGIRFFHGPRLCRISGLKCVP